MNSLTSSSFGIVLDAPLSDPTLSPNTNARLGGAFLAALGVHAALLFCWQQPKFCAPEYGVDFAKSSVEVSLVAALPSETISSVSENTEAPSEALGFTERPAAQTPTEIPAPVPVQPTEPVFEKSPAFSLPEPVPSPAPAPAPKSAPQSAQKHSPSTQLKSAPKNSGDGSSAKPGADSTTAMPSAGASSAKPGYLRNPQPAYPEASRKAGEAGVVTLRVSVDEKGGVSAVQIARSSGFTRLDERAQNVVLKQWRFKAAHEAGRTVGAQLLIPIRFTLDR